MGKTIEIFFDDLTEEKKAEIIKYFGDNQNWDVCPIAIIDVECEKEDCPGCAYYGTGECPGCGEDD